MQFTTECLEGAVHRLTQNHASLSQAQFTMNTKIDSILERLVALTVQPTSPKAPPTPFHTLPHIKLDIPRFDE